MKLIPIELSEANAFVIQFHRHHRAVQGHRFSIAAEKDGKIVGVAIIGRPVARHQQDGWTVEVTRLCTNGTKNACSFLYSRAWRAAQALGWKRLITYILDTENGGSLKAAGFRCIGQAGGGSWNRKNRPRVDKHPIQEKLLWEATCPQRLNQPEGK